VIPEPAIHRLCSLFQLLVEMERAGKLTASSSDLGACLGIGAHNVRKDISYLGGMGISGAGYDIVKLKELIGGRFGFQNPKRACVVGLGRIGSALLQQAQIISSEYSIVAGFDTNINKLETLKTPVEVFPAHQIPEVVRKMKIEIGIITVPVAGAQETADRLIDGGVQGVLNFAPVHLKTGNSNVLIKSIDIAGELRFLSALINEQSELVN
jgi:redox-sensing transcriptional repressor